MHPSRAELIQNGPKQQSDESAGSATWALPLSFGSTSNHREGKRFKHDTYQARKRGGERGQYRQSGSNNNQNSKQLVSEEKEFVGFIIDTKGNHQEEGYYDKRWLEDPWKSMLLELSAAIKLE